MTATRTRPVQAPLDDRLLWATLDDLEDSSPLSFTPSRTTYDDPEDRSSASSRFLAFPVAYE